MHKELVKRESITNVVTANSNMAIHRPELKTTHSLVNRGKPRLYEKDSSNWLEFGGHTPISDTPGSDDELNNQKIDCAHARWISIGESIGTLLVKLKKACQPNA